MGAGELLLDGKGWQLTARNNLLTGPDGNLWQEIVS